MQLTAAHLRYLLAIYEVSRTHLDISSRSIAEKLGVTKPSVVRILNLLMEQGMIVKEYYGKIYLTDRGIWVAKRVQQELDAILAVVIGGASLMGGRFNLLLSVVGALIIQGMNTGILLSGFPPELNQVVKAVVVLCVLIVQSPRFIGLLKGVRGRDKT